MADFQADPRVSIRYCPHCGSDELTERVPARDDRVRLVCGRCGYVHYVGPALAAGLILHDGAGRLCLVQRAWEPSAGLWTFPGGFVDLDEEVSDAARRETAEETGFSAELEEFVGLYSSLGARGKRVVLAVFAGRALEHEPRPCEEVAEVRWFSSAALPWESLAYPSTGTALRDFLSGPRGG